MDPPPRLQAGAAVHADRRQVRAGQPGAQRLPLAAGTARPQRHRARDLGLRDVLRLELGFPGTRPARARACWASRPPVRPSLCRPAVQQCWAGVRRLSYADLQAYQKLRPRAGLAEGPANELAGSRDPLGKLGKQIWPMSSASPRHSCRGVRASSANAVVQAPPVRSRSGAWTLG